MQTTEKLGVELANPGDDPAPKPLLNFREHPAYPIPSFSEQQIIPERSNKLERMKQPIYWAGMVAIWGVITYGANYMTKDLQAIEATEEPTVPYLQPDPTSIPVSNEVPAEIPYLAKENLPELKPFRGESSKEDIKFQNFISEDLYKHDFDEDFSAQISSLIKILNSKVDGNAAGLLRGSTFHFRYSVGTNFADIGEKYTLYYTEDPRNIEFYPALNVVIPAGYSVEQSEVVADFIYSYLNTATVLSDGTDLSLKSIEDLKAAFICASQQVNYTHLPPHITSLLTGVEYAAIRNMLATDIDNSESTLN